MWTRQQYVDRTRSIAEATGAANWDDVLDVLPALGMVHSREWKRLLNANQYLRVSQIAVSTLSTGQIPLGLLDGGAGDTQQRLYRILWVSDGDALYDRVEHGQVPLATISNTATNSRLWYRTDAVLQVLPVASGRLMTVAVNHTPTPIDQVSAPGISVEFPRDYELVLCYEAAAWMTAKGGMATNVTADFQRLADQIRSDMLGDLARESTEPKWIAFPDTSAQWGGL